MKPLITIVFVLICSIILANADQRMLQIYQNGKLSYSINIASIDSMEVVDIPEDALYPEVSKRILKGGEDGHYPYFFDYSNGKITSYRSSGDYAIIYTDSLITIRALAYGSDIIYKLQDGLIVNCTEYYVYKDTEYFEISEFKYDNRKLKSIIRTDITQNDSIRTEYETNRIEFTWDNDVITHQQEWYGRALNLHCDYYYEYSTHRDFGGVCAFLDSNSLLYDDWPQALLVQGYFGDLPKYLLIKATDIVSGGHGINRFEYIYDSDGYPTYMSWILQDGRSIPYIFEWEPINN